MAFNRIWHGAYVTGIPPELEFEQLTISEFLSRNAGKYPSKTALIFMGKRISFRELDTLSNRFAHALRAIGVGAGDRVALLLPNVPQITIAYFGIWRAGATAVPVNPLYSDREIEHQLNMSGASVLITLDLLAERMLALKTKTRLKTIITAHINDYLPFPVKQLFPFVKKGMYAPYRKRPGYYQFMDLMRGSSRTDAPAHPKLDDLAIIPYTGGTTGVSKGAIISHRNISSIVQIVGAWLFDMEEGKESEIALFPFFHMAGFLLVMCICLYRAWEIILVPRPEPEIALDMALKYKPSIFLAVPTIYTGILNLPAFKTADLSFIRAFFSGAAPLPVETIGALKGVSDAKIGVIEGYGMTESTGITHMTPWRGLHKPGSVGVALPNTDMRIVDLETGERELAPGEEGEIVFRGPQMCAGYYNMPEETDTALRNGWFHTGDIGKLDEDGFLYIVDRTKDMIIAGGYNIYPREIDEILYEHPRVLEACTVGVPHEYRGETVKAFVVVKPGETLTAEELDAFCRERLAAFKAPKLYEFVDELPKSAVGKILRKELREQELKKRP
ncbi:MAG: long-chain fatty acid--CoA ligase [Deltaproteobacteria bacterium]|nr:long-chain fatty acid--CoA ligase [Deltaproteobacteria bacterium]